MPALVPFPARVRTGGSRTAPYTWGPRVRVVAGRGTAATASLAAAALADADHRIEVIEAATALPGDIRLEIEDRGTPESYTLAADASGVRIAGTDAAGLFYGVQTLVQLLGTARDKRIGPLEIEDRPRFAYRGVMLDVARHFFPVETIEGYIDRAAALKLNVLHLHLTDDQGWRIQLDRHPELTALGSGTAVDGDPGGFYTKDDYARIVEYAAARHMTVVPEVDGPGHTHAIGLARPDLMEPVAVTDRVLEAVRVFGGGIPAAGAPYTGLAVGFSSLKTRHEQTYELLADVFRELAEMTPGPYLHVGGDEARGTGPADFDLYMDRVTRLVSQLGKTPIAWHEAGSSRGLSRDTIGQYWGYVRPTEHMDEKARTFVRNGAKVILSPADATYLDMKHHADDLLGLVWANGPTSVERSYRWEPARVIDGIEEDDILGVEAPMWTETIRTARDLDAQAFPRIASAAEIAWSPAAAPERTWESFRARVGMLGPQWHRDGIGFFRSPEIEWTEG